MTANHTYRCKRAAVLGAGVMGSGIAAHLAGAGIPTLLLDMVPQDDTRKLPRNHFATNGIANALKAKPAAFYDPEAARLITPGNFEDDLQKISTCDLVIEVIVERLDAKVALFQRLLPVLHKDTLLASNTSGLSIADMTRDLPRDMQERFLVMHFFNPVRYMHLLEIVPGPHTSRASIEKAAQIGEYLGKGVVYGNDTPNFIANRIGIYGLMQVIQTMQTQSPALSIEEIDKIVGKPMGRPSSAAFRTADIVGIDTFVHVSQNCYDSLPNDTERDIFKIPAWMQQLVADKRLGQKSGAGFYKKVGNDILVLDTKTLDYRPQQKVRFESLGAVKSIDDVKERLRSLVYFDDPAGHFAWKVLSTSLCYSAKLVGDIANDIVNIDRAMRWGFNWDLGPFEAWDAIGVETSVKRMQQDDLHVPQWVLDMLKRGESSFYSGAQSARYYASPKAKAPVALPVHAKEINLAAIKDDKKRVIQSNMGASLVDIGDGCLLIEVHTKMNTIDSDVIAMITEGIQEAERNFTCVVLGNDSEHFGAGANLMLVYLATQQKAWDDLSHMVTTFQAASQLLHYARVPVVAAPYNYTFGGALEFAMSAAACQAYAETYAGLVEVGVGLVPGGSGCLRMVQRFTYPVQEIEGVDLLPFIGQASLNIALAKVSTSAKDAQKLRWLRSTDGISSSREYLLYDAKQRALGLAKAGYRPPQPGIIKASGIDAARTIGVRVWGMQESGYASEHDAKIANKVAFILCGGHVAAGAELTDQHYLDLEREAFLSLAGEEKTQARIQAMLTTGKPLRN